MVTALLRPWKRHQKVQNIAVKPPAPLHLWLHLGFKHLDVISTIDKSKDHSLFSHRLDYNAPC